MSNARLTCKCDVWLVMSPRSIKKCFSQVTLPIWPLYRKNICTRLLKFEFKISHRWAIAKHFLLHSLPDSMIITHSNWINFFKESTLSISSVWMCMCVHFDHCRVMSSGYWPLSVDSWLWNSGNCVSTGTLMVRRRRWTLHDAERLSCKNKGRICWGRERKKETDTQSKKLRTDNRLNKFNKSTDTT